MNKFLDEDGKLKRVCSKCSGLFPKKQLTKTDKGKELCKECQDE